MMRAAEFAAENSATLQALIAAQQNEIAHLKLLVAKLQRQQFGRRAERFDANADQLNLLGEAAANLMSAGTSDPAALLPAARPTRTPRCANRCPHICRARA